jgi:hypothetical protein
LPAGGCRQSQVQGRGSSARASAFHCREARSTWFSWICRCPRWMDM